MTTSAARIAPAADAKSGSTARRAPSGPTPSRPPCAAQPAARSRTPPRSPCSTARRGRLQESLATVGGTSSRSGRRRRRRRPAASAGRAPARPTAYATSSGRTTRVLPTPARAARPPRASRRGWAVRLPFFEPAGDGLARDAEGAREATQTAALVVGAKYLLALLFTVSVRPRLFAAALRAVAAQVTLPPVGGQPVTHDVPALAVLTSEGDNNHGPTLACHPHLSH